VTIPLPWERLLWSGRSCPPRPTVRYFLTDFRVVRSAGRRTREIALHDIADVERTQSWVERRLGLSTITIHSIDGDELVFRRVRRGGQLAALLELFSGEPLTDAAVEAVRATLDWEPRGRVNPVRRPLAGAAAVATAIVAAVIGLHGKTAPAAFAADDPLFPDGRKRTAPEIAAFMQQAIMPWARRRLAPIVGGADRVTCDTCHGGHSAARAWAMPAVDALPAPDLRGQGWELYGGVLDAQMRNAIYGYLAERDKQPRAAYMREVIVPEMAQLLRRPAYDFTQPYEYNRSRRAFGCYHCHKMK
jgi:hypothetical protein